MHTHAGAIVPVAAYKLCLWGGGWGPNFQKQLHTVTHFLRYPRTQIWFKVQ